MGEEECQPCLDKIQIYIANSLCGDKGDEKKCEGLMGQLLDKEMTIGEYVEKVAEIVKSDGDATFTVGEIQKDIEQRGRGSEYFEGKEEV